MQEQMIAPCGMNCSICSGYLALKHDIKSKGLKFPYCEGCRPRDRKCAFLKKRCDLLMNDKVKYCYECKEYPCDKLKAIDKRYKTNFRMSMIENLEFIKEKGMDKFLKQQRKRWKCPKCGDTICCHNGICFSCGTNKLKKKKKRYRWED